MAVTIIQQPDAVALTMGGRMAYQFHGNGRVVQTGVLAINSILIIGAILEGEVINLFWKGQNLKMIARETPSEPYEFPAGDGSDEYITSILPYFRDYYPIEADFIVEAVTPSGPEFDGLKFTAKLPGPDYNFASSGGGTHAYVVGNGTVGLAPQLRERYSVYVEVWSRTPGTLVPKRVYSTALEADEDGNCTVDLGSTLHGILQEDLPIWTVPSAQPNISSWCHYFIKYAEAWGEPLRPGRLTTADTHRAYLGGMPYEQMGRFRLADFAMPGGNDDASRDKFLRIGPSLRYIRPDEPQFLTFLNLRPDLVGLKLAFEVTLDDNSKVYYQNRHLPIDCSQYGKITWPIGIVQANLRQEVPDGRTIKEYTIRAISDATGFLSETIRFVVDYRYQPFVRYFVYVTSLGAIDTIYTYGKGSSELALFREQAEAVLPLNYELSDGQFIEYDTALQRQEDVATGWRSELDLRFFNDFYRANRRFRLLTDRVRPIGILSKSIKQAKDGDTTFAHKFEYAYLYKDEFYYQTEEGEPLPPAGFAPAGSVSVQPVQVVPSRDATIPDAVREIDQEQVNDWNEAHAWGDHKDEGYLTQQGGSAVFAPVVHQHNYADLLNKPTTAAGFGLTNVPKIGAKILMTQYPKLGISKITAVVDDVPFPLVSAFKRIPPKLFY